MLRDFNGNRKRNFFYYYYFFFYNLWSPRKSAHLPSISPWPSLPLLFSPRLSSATQLLTHEFYRLQASSEKQIAELQAQNAEQASRLETYEKLEQELDQVTVQAAQSKSADWTRPAAAAVTLFTLLERQK